MTISKISKINEIQSLITVCCFWKNYFDMRNLINSQRYFYLKLYFAIYLIYSYSYKSVIMNTVRSWNWFICESAKGNMVSFIHDGKLLDGNFIFAKKLLRSEHFLVLYTFTRLICQVLITNSKNICTKNTLTIACVGPEILVEPLVSLVYSVNLWSMPPGQSEALI